jgi:AcrR family transcriptional regulator
MAAVTPQRRLPAADRRAQLLDEAAALLVTGGPSALTMERLAERAGVSKALPYRHFADADAVLVALYQRETGRLGAGVHRALRDAPEGADLVRVSVRAYFDELVPRRELLIALSSPGRAIPALADPDDAGTRFAAGLLREFHGLDRASARAVAGMIQGAIVGAAGTVLAGVASRRAVEEALVVMIHAALERGRRR